MQISVVKVIESLINLVYTLNVITIKVHQSWGSLQDQGVPPFLFQVRGLQLPEGFPERRLGAPLGPWAGPGLLSVQQVAYTPWSQAAGPLVSALLSPRWVTLGCSVTSPSASVSSCVKMEQPLHRT